MLIWSFVCVAGVARRANARKQRDGWQSGGQDSSPQILPVPGRIWVPALRLLSLIVSPAAAMLMALNGFPLGGVASGLILPYHLPAKNGLRLLKYKALHQA